MGRSNRVHVPPECWEEVVWQTVAALAIFDEILPDNERVNRIDALAPLCKERGRSTEERANLNDGLDFMFLDKLGKRISFGLENHPRISCRRGVFVIRVCSRLRIE